MMMQINNKDETFHNLNICHYIYLLREREFVKSNEDIYKIGKTKQENLARFNSYPNSSQLLFHMICSNCDKIERNIINLFKRKYILRGEIGKEYFQGNLNYMLNDIIYEIFNYNINIKNNILYQNPTKTINFDIFKYNDNDNEDNNNDINNDNNDNNCDNRDNIRNNNNDNNDDNGDNRDNIRNKNKDNK
jgi:hypothetical protein